MKPIDTEEGRVWIERRKSDYVTVTGFNIYADEEGREFLGLVCEDTGRWGAMGGGISGSGVYDERNDALAYLLRHRQEKVGPWWDAEDEDKPIHIEGDPAERDRLFGYAIILVIIVVVILIWR